MKKTYFPTIFLLTLHIIPAIAQDYDEPEFDSKPGLMIKIDAIQLLDIFPTTMIGVQHILANEVYLSHEIGKTFGVYPNEFTRDVNKLERNARGFKLREEVRAYASRSHPKSGAYAGFAFHYSFTNLEADHILGYDCTDDLSCDYYQEILAPVTRQKYGITMIYGKENLDFKPFVLDVSFGFGIQVREYSTQEFEDNSMVVRTPKLRGYDNNLDGFSFLATFSLKAGFLIF